MGKKGQGLSLNTIIIAIIVLVVLVVVVMIFTGATGTIAPKYFDCDQKGANYKCDSACTGEWSESKLFGCRTDGKPDTSKKCCQKTINI